MLKRHLLGATVITLVLGLVAAGPVAHAAIDCEGTISGPDIVAGEKIIISAINPKNSRVLTSQTLEQPTSGGGFTDGMSFELKTVLANPFILRLSSNIDGVKRSWFWVSEEDGNVYPSTRYTGGSGTLKYKMNGTSDQSEATLLGSCENLKIEFGTISGTLSKDESDPITPSVSVASRYAVDSKLLKKVTIVTTKEPNGLNQTSTYGPVFSFPQKCQAVDFFANRSETYGKKTSSSSKNISTTSKLVTTVVTETWTKTLTGVKTVREKKTTSLTTRKRSNNAIIVGPTVSEVKTTTTETSCESLPVEVGASQSSFDTGNRELSSAQRFQVRHQKVLELASGPASQDYKVRFLPHRTDYAISFTDPNLSYQSDWYTGSPDPGGAELFAQAKRDITLNTDSDTADVDFLFKRAYEVTGVIKNPVIVEKDREGRFFSAVAAPRRSVQALRVDGVGTSTKFNVVSSTFADGDGEFSIKGLRLDKKYVIRFAGIAGRSNVQTEYFTGKVAESCFHNQLPYKVMECSPEIMDGPESGYSQNLKMVDADGNPVNFGEEAAPLYASVELQKGGEIKGRVTFPGKHGRGKVGVRAYGSDGVSRWTYTDPTGYYTITGLTAGRYKVEANFDGDRDYYKKRRYYNGKTGGTTSSGSATYVTVTNGNTTSIKNLYSDAPAYLYLY